MAISGKVCVAWKGWVLLELTDALHVHVNVIGFADS